MQNLSSIQIYLDAASLLPVEFAFNSHTDADATYDIPIQVFFSNYQSFQGIQIPTHIQKFVTGTLAFDIAVKTANVNSGLLDSIFSITTTSE